MVTNLKSRYMRRYVLILFVLMAGVLQAQISPEVKTVVKNCADKMHNPAGVEMNMRLNVKALAVISVNGTIKMYMKGEKSLAKMRMKILGRDIRTETGFDGKQMWVYKPAVEEGDKDTLIIMEPTAKERGEFEMDFDLYNEYRKAKMKEKEGRYEITFTDPIDKNMPKKTVMVINKSDHTFYEMAVKDGATGFTMTATNIKFGVEDGMFSLDSKRYQDAVTVHRSSGER